MLPAEIHAELGRDGKRQPQDVAEARAGIDVRLERVARQPDRAPEPVALPEDAPPPAGAKSPALWGTRARLAELFEPQAASIKSAQRNFVFRYRSPEHWLGVFKTYYGPVLKTFAALDPARQAALQDDLLALIAEFNRSGDGSMVVPGEYLEVVVTRG